MCWAWTFIQALSLHDLSVSRCFRCDWVLVTLSTTTRRKREHVLLMIAGIASGVTVVSSLAIRHAVCSICSFLWCFYHWWQLQLLVVWVITFFSVVPFAVTHHLFVQLSTSLSRRWILGDPDWAWILCSNACVQRGISTRHQIDVVEAPSNQMPWGAGLVISQVELVEMIWTVHYWVTSVITRRVLVLLDRVEIVITTTCARISISAELAVALPSLCPALAILIIWAWDSS